jgi:tetratricopeptide (TPR) repeat protein
MKLSAVYAANRDFAKAEEYYRAGEHAFRHLPEENLRRAFIIYQGRFLYHQGDFAAFEKLFQDYAFAAIENGEGSTNFSSGISSLQQNYYEKTGNFNKWIELNKLLISLEGGNPMPNQDEIGQNKAEIAYCLLRLGKTKEAGEYFKEAFQGFKNSRDNNLWIYEAYIGKCLYFLNRRREAEPYLKNAFANYTAKMPPGKEHIEIAEMLQNLSK